MITIAGGSFKGRKINFPDIKGVRPTTVMVRSSIFNVIQSRFADEFFGNKWLDVFTGSGAMSLEALSWGAKSTSMIEKNPKVFFTIKKIFEEVKDLEPGQCEFFLGDFQKIIPNKKNDLIADGKFSMVFIDPPYEMGFVNKSIDLILTSDIIVDGAILIVEFHKRERPEDRAELECVTEKDFGDTIVAFYRYKQGS